MLGLLAFGLPIVVALAAHPLLGLPRRRRSLAVVLLVLVMLPMPRLLAAEPPLWRAALAMLVLLSAGKVFDIHQQPGPRPAFAAYARFVLNPFTAVLRKLGDEPRPTPRQSLGRLGRGLILAALAGAALVGVSSMGPSSSLQVLDHAPKVVTFFVALEGLLMASVSAVRLCGVPAREVFDQPYLAATPADFWRRYNRVVGQLLYEDVFRRVGGRHAPVRATVVTFVVSAIAHEYMFAVALGRIEGHQLLFFLVQGAAVAATLGLRPRGPWVVVGIGLTLLFNLTTSMWFFSSIDRLYPWFAR